MIKDLILTAAGGALGSIGRYAMTLLASQMLVRTEWATFAVNVLGSFLIGLILPDAKSGYMLFFSVGVCGGFTTFSTFSAQSMRLLHDGQYLTGLAYILGTVLVSLAMVALGWYCRQKIWG